MSSAPLLKRCRIEGATYKERALCFWLVYTLQPAYVLSRSLMSLLVLRMHLRIYPRACSCLEGKKIEGETRARCPSEGGKKGGKKEAVIFE